MGLLKNKLTLLAIFFGMTSLQAQENDSKLANEYYQQGEYDKALVLYQNLENKKNAIPIIHANYIELLFQGNDLKKTEKYLKNIIKKYPDNLRYQIDLLYFYQKSGQNENKKKIIKYLFEKYGNNQYQLSTVARQLVSRKFYVEAIGFYKKARQINKNESVFCLDMANIYSAMGDKPNMINEYLNFAKFRTSNIDYVKNLLQNSLKEEDDLDYLNNVLVDNIQKNPVEKLYIELLIWLELQRKNFHEAFVQARALDKRFKEPGNECIKVAEIALDNKAWDDAIEIYQYIVDEHPQKSNYELARQLLIKAKENKVKTTYPIDKTVVENLVAEYLQLYSDIGANNTSLEALRSGARLYAFYLNRSDTAIVILNTVIKHPRASGKLVSETKLDLGDLYILAGQPWESTLLYSQVEKAHKDSPIAYEAKFRNARLNYYTGNFNLAKSHLDILKLATTRTISNDAISMSLLISDNTAFDSTDQVMQSFASAELMVYMKQNDNAKPILDGILKNHSNHQIADEIYWLQAQIALEENNVPEAIAKLQLILDTNGGDILADDACFRIAVIKEEKLQDHEGAKIDYQDFLKKYPGSRHIAEARLRFRKLRGDLSN